MQDKSPALAGCIASSTTCSKGEAMKHVLSSIILALTAAAAQASVYKCQTPAGLVYLEHPCPPGSASQTIHASASAGGSNSSGSKIDAVPLPAPDKQRGAYEAHQSKPNPKAFVICTDGRVMSLVGKSEFVRQRLASLDAGCSPYSIDDSVVWSK